MLRDNTYLMYCLQYMQVYKDQTNVDEYLVNSIVQPTADPNAAEVYYRYLSL